MKTLLLTVAALLALAAPASAAVTPVDLGAGVKPSVVVDPAGTAHIVFLPDTFGVPQYCRLPRGATACDVRVALGDSDQIEQVEILRRDSDGVLIFVGRATDRLWLAFSSDGGASWVPAGWNAALVGLSETFTLAPGGQSVLVWRAGRPGQTGIGLYNAAFGAPDTRFAVVEDGSTSGADETHAATLPDGRILAGATSSSGFTWRLFTGGDPLDLSRWGKRGHIKDFWPDVSLAAGPRGLSMIENSSSRIRKDITRVVPLWLRTFDLKRQRWSRPSPIFEDRGGAYDEVRAGQDAAGRLHALTTVTTGGRYCLQYARTGTRRTSGFGRTTVLARRTLPPEEPDLGVAADGGGAVVWQERSTSPEETRVWAAPLQAAKGKYRRVPSRRQHVCR